MLAVHGQHGLPTCWAKARTMLRSVLRLWRRHAENTSDSCTVTCERGAAMPFQADVTSKVVLSHAQASSQCTTWSSKYYWRAALESADAERQGTWLLGPLDRAAGHPAHIWGVDVGLLDVTHDARKGFLHLRMAR